MAVYLKLGRQGRWLLKKVQIHCFKYVLFNPCFCFGPDTPWEALRGGSSHEGFPHLPWALPCAGWFSQVPELGGMFSIDAMGLHGPGPVWVLFSPWGFSSLNTGKRKSTPRFPDLYHPHPLTRFQASAPPFQEPAGCPLLQLQSFHPPTHSTYFLQITLPQPQP